MAPGTSALHTDHYELTMVDAALRDGTADRPCVFEVFARRLPAGRRYGIVAGIARLVEAVDRFRFGPDEIEWLRQCAFLHADTLDWLASYRFSGSILGYREGEAYFPGSPVLTVEAGFAEAVVLETVVLSILNHDSAVASAAARMVSAAAGRPLIEMGGRRVHEEAAVAAARAAYLAGFASTSNLEAGRRYGVPTAGTAAHAFVLVHDGEDDAFSSQVHAAGPATTLLVDTFDYERAIRAAVAIGGPGLGAIRLDSGDLASQARAARATLDDLGNRGTRIVASGDLDEFSIAALVAGAPVDVFGVGTSVVTGSGAPTGGLVYKLVAREDATGVMAGVAKRSPGKEGVGGRKWAWRALDSDGRSCGEVTRSVDEPPDAAWLRARGLDAASARALQVPLVADGRAARVSRLDDARAHHRVAIAELDDGGRALEPGEPAFIAVHL